MAYDKVVDSIQLETAITETADAIRAKIGNTDPIAWVANKGFADVISLITSGKELVKVGTILSAYQMNTLDIKNTYSKYADITVNDIYLVPDTFTITKDGTITGGTYNLNKTYDASTGILTAWRDSIKGEVGLDFNCDVYIYGDIGENNGSGGTKLFDQVVTGTYIPADENKSELPVPSSINAEDIVLFVIWISEPSVEYSPYSTLTQGVWFKFVEYEDRPDRNYSYGSDSGGSPTNSWPYLSVSTNRITFGTSYNYLRVGVEYTYMFCTGKRGIMLEEA